MSSVADRGHVAGRVAAVAGFAAHHQLQGRRLLVGAAALTVTVGLIGMVDAATGSDISFGIFYLVPVSVAAALTGTRVATGLAALSAVVWVLADRAIGDHDPAMWLAVVNVALRFSILGFVVMLVAAIRNALRSAQDSDRRSREFLAFAAHQLRTPTAAISATAQSMLAQGQDREQEDALVRMVSESSRIGRLVTSVLRFIRLDQGDPMPTQLVDVGLVCAAEVQRHRDLARPVSIDHALEPGGSLMTLASPDALSEAIGNLLDNALRHARQHVVVTTRRNGRLAEVVVADDGPGLPPGTEERVFEPFMTFDGSHGTGLGLSIARRLVESQGGSLRYAHGAFVLTTPLRR